MEMTGMWMPGTLRGGGLSSRALGMAAMGAGLEATWRRAGSPAVGPRTRGMMMWGTAVTAVKLSTWDQPGSPAAAPALAGASCQGTLAARAVTAEGSLGLAAPGANQVEARAITTRATVRTVHRGGSSAAASHRVPQRPAAAECAVGAGTETRGSRVTRVGAERLPPKLRRRQFMTRWVLELLEPSQPRSLHCGRK